MVPICSLSIALEGRSLAEAAMNFGDMLICDHLSRKQDKKNNEKKKYVASDIIFLHDLEV